MDASVMSVTEVSFVIIHGDPPGLVIHASASTPDSGWSHARLLPHFYVVAPPDGIWDFDFVASMPILAMREPSTVQAEQLALMTPPWFKGVRVHAGSNRLEAHEPARILFAQEAMTLGGPAIWPWPARRAATVPATAH